MLKKKILVIEDDMVNRELIREALQAGDYHVLEAHDAEKGIELIRTYSPALILMDISLPGMDGLSATKTIKEDQTLKHIPVVVLTAHAMSGDKQKAKDAGCNGYITKPFNVIEILEYVDKFFQS